MRRTAGREPLWLVLIGHGTFDGREAKFNLRGPDVSAAELADWLKPIKRPLAILDCSSSSGPFVNRLSGEDRVVVTATRSGDEQNFARLGQYLAEAIADPAADLDKDGQVSLLEAFLTAGARTEEFYRTKARLATEHALIDDNGDRLGTPADWFRGIHATKRVKSGAAVDGVARHQLHLIRNDREQTDAARGPRPPRRARTRRGRPPRYEGHDPRGRLLRPARKDHGRAGAALPRGESRLHREVTVDHSRPVDGVGSRGVVG